MNPHPVQEGDDAWTLMLDGLSQRGEVVAHSISRGVERQADLLAVELATTRQELRDPGDVAGRSRFYSQVIQRSAGIAVKAPDYRCGSMHHAAPPGLQKFPVLEPEPEPEPAPEPDMGVVLQHLLSPAGLPSTPQRPPQLPRSYRSPTCPTTPCMRAALNRKEQAAATRRRRGSPEALAAEARRRQSTGLHVAAEVAMYRARLVDSAAIQSDSDSGALDEGEPPMMSMDTSAAATRSQQNSTAVQLVHPSLLEWFRARNLSSLADIVCAGLGLRSTADLTTVTPDALTKLANAKHPKLNPLRLRRLKDALALQGESSSAAWDWVDWSPPPASSSQRADALASLGLKASMCDRTVSNTRQILARETLSRAEVERVTREERARLEHAKRQWCERSEERGQIAHNATVSGNRGASDEAQRC
jgi:hypothetical protein